MCLACLATGVSSDLRQDNGDQDANGCQCAKQAFKRLSEVPPSDRCLEQKFLLLFCLILVFSRTLCDAHCYLRPASKYGCLSNGNLYVFGAVWKNEDCYQCRCKTTAMICCSLVFIPKNYDRVNCVGLFHKKSCTIRVVKKTNPDIICKSTMELVNHT
ncbi:beta-microseminoprotein-like [Cuculus canorus]|uniref:beta-microseminoprotein-like n=1 Tax=Cuculus canorus TaxID=55661 RepID=UPI0023AAF75A|nr:beta-microseminoprotein-like [Cuculus canorus]